MRIWRMKNTHRSTSTARGMIRLPATARSWSPRARWVKEIFVFVPAARSTSFSAVSGFNHTSARKRSKSPS